MKVKKLRDTTLRDVTSRYAFSDIRHNYTVGRHVEVCSVKDGETTRSWFEVYARIPNDGERVFKAVFTI